MARIEQVWAGEKSWGAYFVDILGHTGIGAAASLLVVIPAVLLDWPWGAWLVPGELLALGAGTLREWRQYKKSGKLHLLDRVLDIAHHAFGPPVAWGLTLAVVAIVT